MTETKTYVGVLVKCKDKFLLCKRNAQGSFPGMWSIPAGKVEGGEETIEASKREFFEETAINIDDKELKFVGLIPRHTRDGKKIKGTMYVYQLDTDNEVYPDLANAIDGEEHSECGYFTINEIKTEMVGTFLQKLIEIISKKVDTIK